MTTYRVTFTVEEGHSFITEAEDQYAAEKQFRDLRHEDLEKLISVSKHRWSEVCYLSTHPL